MAYVFNPFTGNLDTYGPVLTGTGTVSAAADGTAALPGIAFASDLNTGIYRPGTDQLALSTNGTGRLFIDSSGRVGLGTSSPRTRLHVQGGDVTLDTGLGTSAATLDIVSDVNTNNGQDAAPGIAFRAPYASGSSDRPTYAATWSKKENNAQGVQNGSLIFGTNTNGSGITEKLRIDSSGRVGIGTTSPTETLHVDGNIRLQGNGYLSASNSTADMYLFAGATNRGGQIDLVAGQAATDAGAIRFRTGTGGGFTAQNERARIDSSGRLLVGTSSALSIGGNHASFQVESSPSILHGGSFVRHGGTNPIAGSTIAIGRSRGTSAGAVTAVENNDTLGYILFCGANGTDYSNNAAWISCQVDGTPGANDMPGRLVFAVTADGASSSTEAMRINNARELLVGYTSDNGAYKLQVNSQIFATSATIATSDGRYKENVATLDGCVDLVKALRPVSFDWKHQEPITRVDEEGETVVVREAHNFPDGTQVGFIAQEVETVLADKPWLGSVIKQNVRPAVTDNDGNELAPEEEFLGIAESNLVAVLTSALKDAIGRIESLEAEVAALKA